MRAGTVTIFANPDCPHCVRATETLAEWCAECGIAVAGVDLTQHPEVAAHWRIEHSPSILVERPDGRTRLLADVPTHEEFLRAAL